MLPHVYKELVDLSDIAQKFFSSNERRSTFFGKFYEQVKKCTHIHVTTHKLAQN